MRGVEITNVEYYLPSVVLDNDQLAKEFPDWSSKKIERFIGVKNRHIADPEVTSGDMAYEVAQKIFLKYDKNEIDHLILCTQSPDYFYPTTACLLQDRLGLKESTGAFDFNLGCSGYVYGLAIAKGLIVSGVANNVLLITSDTSSRAVSDDDVATKLLFGDAATATVLTVSDEMKILDFELGTSGNIDDLVLRNGGFRHPFISKKAELQAELDSRDSYLYMNGTNIFNFLIDVVPGLIDNCLKKNGLNIDDIDYFLFHQANKFMLTYLRQKLNIPKEKFYLDMTESGNTSSNTIGIAFKESIDRKNIKKGDKVLLAGFGVGYSWGATVIEY